MWSSAPFQTSNQSFPIEFVDENPTPEVGFVLLFLRWRHVWHCEGCCPNSPRHGDHACLHGSLNVLPRVFHPSRFDYGNVLVGCTQTLQCRWSTNSLYRRMTYSRSTPTLSDDWHNNSYCKRYVCSIYLVDPGWLGITFSDWVIIKRANYPFC
jgi:hypothetical protein